MTERWRGTYTALVTPFRADGAVDVSALERLVSLQIEGGVEGIVPLGTTGESATVDRKEKLEILERIHALCEGRVPVMAGAGGNATSETVRFGRDAEAAGADALLSVVPYYNKPNQEGLYAHFAALADSVGVPVFLYDVPARTGCRLRPETVARLARHGNVGGIKDATGDLPHVMELLEARPGGFRVLSGEDALTLPLLALGADGVISVASNEVPALMSSMVRLGLAHRFEEARSLHYRLLPLMKANFLDTNPIPVKAALALMGQIEESYRLPLTRMGSAERESLREILAAMDLVPTDEESKGRISCTTSPS